MGDLLYLIAFVLIILWLVGYIGFGPAVGSFIHVLLILAIVAVIMGFVRGRPEM